MDIIDKIKALALKNGISQGELSRTTGIERPNITNLLNKKGAHANPTVATLTKICDALGVDLDLVEKSKY